MRKKISSVTVHTTLSTAVGKLNIVSQKFQETHEVDGRVKYRKSGVAWVHVNHHTGTAWKEDGVWLSWEGDSRRT